MNYQNDGVTLQSVSNERAANILKERYYKDLDLGAIMFSLEYYAWPEAFGSTAGPFNAVGGQTVSTFTVEA